MLFQLADRIFGAGDLVADGSGVNVDLIIISALKPFVSIEMDLIVIIFDELEAIRFVPSTRENFKRNLTSDTELQVNV